MIIQIQATPINVNIIQAYARTAEKDDIQIGDFYQQIHEALKITQKHEITFHMGDFIAKVEQVTIENVPGRYSLGERNKKGRRLIELCQEAGFVQKWKKLYSKQRTTKQSESPKFLWNYLNS